ncbi:MAG: hypothetical protein WBQ10_01625 [Terriglobales bacterium]
MARLPRTALFDGALSANGSQFRPIHEEIHVRILGRLLVSPCANPAISSDGWPVPIMTVQFKLHHYPHFSNVDGTTNPA